MKEIMPIDGQFAIELGTVISKETLSFHYGKHLKAYVDNLNKMLPGSGLEGMPLSEVVRKAEGGLFNNAGQVLNHTLYFEQFSNTPQPMSAKLSALLEKSFGSVEAFKKEFEQKGVTLFGSAGHHAAEERGEPSHYGIESAADVRRVGARLLPRIPEPPRRPPRRPVADSRLAGSGRPPRSECLIV